MWDGSKRDLICSWKVVLPALSRPRIRIEYSGRLLERWEIELGTERCRKEGRNTFFAGGPEVKAFC